MAKKATQKFKYLENEESLARSIFHHFKRAFIEGSKTFFLEGESPSLKTSNNHTIIITNISDKIRI